MQVLKRGAIQADLSGTDAGAEPRTPLVIPAEFDLTSALTGKDIEKFYDALIKSNESYAIDEKE